MHNNRLFCFGYGYTCDYLGHALMEEGGWQVAGTTRDSNKRASLKKRGIDAHLFDYEIPLADPGHILKDVTHLLISTPPDDHGGPTYRMHEEDIVRMPNLKWMGYLSTIGVYGDRDGGWVDETAQVQPSTRRGTRRASAEKQWMDLARENNLPLHTFRIAGIYGPGRSALDSIRAGVARRIDKPGHAFNRIHVEDIVNVLRASIAKPNPGSIYNVADDDPVPSHVVIDYACQLLKRPSPPLIPFDKVDLAPITRSFYSDNKRIKNDKIKNELGVTLKYPSYKEGLKACLEAENYAMSLFRKVDPYGGGDGGESFG